MPFASAKKIPKTFVFEPKSVAAILLRWFNKKFNSQHLEIDLGRKVVYETKNPIKWDKDKYYICNFPIKINTKGPNIPVTEMSYTDFYIGFEHKFLRNIYSKKVLATPTI